MKRREAGADGPVGGARLTRGIGDVGDHPVGEHRQAVDRHTPVGLCWKLDGELSIGIGRGAAPQNPGRAAVERKPREEPATPGGKAHLSLDPVADLRAGYRQAGVGGGGADKRNGLVEDDPIARRGELDFELWPLVLLDAKPEDTGRSLPLGDDHPLPRQGACGNGKLAVERAGRVRCLRLPGKLAAIGVAKRHAHLAAGQRPVVALRPIGMGEDSLVADDLSGAMDAAVGHEDEARMLLRLLLVPEGERIGGDLVEGAVERRRKLEERLTLWLDGKLVKTVGIGRRLTGRLKRRGIAGLGTDEGLHAHVGQRPSGGAIDDMARQGAAGAGKDIRAADHRQPAHPHKRRGDDVVVGAEVVVGAREHPIRAGGKILRRLEVVGVVAEVVRGGEVDGEGLEGLRSNELRPVAIIEPLPLRLAGAEPGEPIGFHDSDVDFREVFVTSPDRRPGGGPGPLREHFE